MISRFKRHPNPTPLSAQSSLEVFCLRPNSRLTLPQLLTETLPQLLEQVRTRTLSSSAQVFLLPENCFSYESYIPSKEVLSYVKQLQALLASTPTLALAFSIREDLSNLPISAPIHSGYIISANQIKVHSKHDPSDRDIRLMKPEFGENYPEMTERWIDVSKYADFSERTHTFPNGVKIDLYIGCDAIRGSFSSDPYAVALVSGDQLNPMKLKGLSGKRSHVVLNNGYCFQDIPAAVTHAANVMVSNRLDPSQEFIQSFVLQAPIREFPASEQPHLFIANLPILMPTPLADFVPIKSTNISV